MVGGGFVWLGPVLTCNLPVQGFKPGQILGTTQLTADVVWTEIWVSAQSAVRPLKAKKYISLYTYIARQAADCSCSGAFVIQPTGRDPSPHPPTLTCNQTAIRSPGLLFDGFHMHV